jgi:hypothetical protein
MALRMALLIRPSDLAGAKPRYTSWYRRGCYSLPFAALRWRWAASQERHLQPSRLLADPSTDAG